MTASGGLPPARASTSAPIRRNGSATRPIGRDRSDASPVKKVTIG
jgi:hypothetical protein